MSEQIQKETIKKCQWLYQILNNQILETDILNWLYHQLDNVRNRNQDLKGFNNQKQV